MEKLHRAAKLNEGARIIIMCKEGEYHEIIEMGGAILDAQVRAYFVAKVEEVLKKIARNGGFECLVSEQPQYCEKRDK